MRILLHVILLMGLAGGIVAAETGGDGVFPYVSRTETLANGLTVIMIPMSGSGLMSYYSIVRTGARDEYEAGKTGFAHFFEHMMFRGTKNYPAAKYDRMVTEMGANANAYTTDDYTAYHLSFAAEKLETVVRLESDRFQFLEYEVAAFQTEAGAVYGEYRKNRSNPWQVLFEVLLRNAFTRHTYGHTTIGFEEDIKAMPKLYDYSREFFSRYYRPDNVVLLLVGDFEPETAMKFIRKYYSDWQAGYQPPAIPVEAEQTGERTAQVSYEGKTLPLLMVSYKAPAFDVSDARMVAGSMLGELLFGETSAIYRKLVLKEQTVQFISAEFGFNRDPRLWSIYAMVKDETDITAVRAEIDRTIDQFSRKTVDEAELRNLKKRLRYSFLMNLDSPDAVAANLARLIAITGGMDVIDNLYTAYDRVTPKNIRDAVRQYLTPERRTIVTLTGRE